MISENNFKDGETISLEAKNSPQYDHFIPDVFP